MKRTHKEIFIKRDVLLKRNELFDINKSPALDSYEQFESQVIKFMARMGNEKFDIVLLTIEEREDPFNYTDYKSNRIENYIYTYIIQRLF